MTISRSNKNLSAVIEHMSGNIAVIDTEGFIVAVNNNWNNFALSNGISDNYNWIQKNYIEICNSANSSDSDAAIIVLEGIYNLIKGVITSFIYEYPAHTAFREYWYELRANIIKMESCTYILLIHHDTTQNVADKKRSDTNRILYNNIVRSAPFGIGLFKNGCFYYSNPKLMEQFEQEDFLSFFSTSIADMVHPEDKISTLSYKSPIRSIEQPQYRFKENPDTIFHRYLSKKYSPSTIFIDKEFNILFIKGDAGNRLRHSEGLFQNNLLKIVSADVAAVIRNGIRRIEAENKDIIIKDIVISHSSEKKCFDLTFHKPTEDEELRNIYLIHFSEDRPLPDEYTVIENIPLDEVSKQRLMDLENELKATKNELQNVVEELETSNEELQSSNEELMASNEELQSTNEEL